MLYFVAVYAGETVGSSKMVALSSDPEVVWSVMEAISGEREAEVSEGEKCADLELFP